MAGSGPELSSYLPWRDQGKREEAAAVVSPLGVVLRFTFISPKGRGAGEGGQGSKRKTEGKGENWYVPRERAMQRGQGGGRLQAEARTSGVAEHAFFLLCPGWDLAPSLITSCPSLVVLCSL